LWVSVLALVVVIAFISVVAGNGNSGVAGVGNDPAPAATTIARPSLPGESTDSTVGGTSARCKDGTYSFKGGGEPASDVELCQNNGGVEQRLP
jgi:hypothetical protein